MNFLYDLLLIFKYFLLNKKIKIFEFFLNTKKVTYLSVILGTEKHNINTHLSFHTRRHVLATWVHTWSYSTPCPCSVTLLHLLTTQLHVLATQFHALPIQYMSLLLLLPQLFINIPHLSQLSFYARNNDLTTFNFNYIK